MVAYYKRHWDRYATEIASYAQDGQNYIAFMNEKNYPSGKGIHLLDSYSIFHDMLVLKAQEHVRGNKITERDALARIMEKYMEDRGNSFENMKKFYLSYVDMISKGLTPQSTEKEKENAQNISDDVQIDLLNKWYTDISQEFRKKKKDTTNLENLDAWKNFVCEEFTLAMFEISTHPNLFNTDCIGNLPVQRLKTGYKENDPLKTFNFNFKDLIGTPYEQKIKAWCKQEGNNICEVFFLKGAWHEATHCRGTDDEYKTEAFAYLKMLQKFKEPALLETSFFGRANAALDRIEATRHEVYDLDIKTKNTNWTYQMIPLLNHLRENAPTWVNDDNFLNMSNQALMNMAIEISNDPKLRYPKNEEENFRKALKVPANQLVDTLKREAKKDGIVRKILSDAMEFYNSYRTEDDKYETIDAFIEDKRTLFDNEANAQQNQAEKRETKKDGIVGRIYGIVGRILRAAMEFYNSYRTEVKTSQSEFKLSEEDITSYTEMYTEWRQKNTKADTSEFCKVVIDKNFEKIASIEAEYNKDGSLFFDEERCRKDSEQIRNILNHCQNAGEIVTLLTSQGKQSTRDISATGKDSGRPEGPPPIPQAEEVKFNPSHNAGEIVTLLTSQEKQSTRNIPATGKDYGTPEGPPTIPQVEEVKLNQSHLAILKKERA